MTIRKAAHSTWGSTPSGRAKKTKTVTQLKKTEDHSHKERVAMREILRQSRLFTRDTSNEPLDAWLMSHGYLQRAGYKPKAGRVERLRRSVGVSRTWRKNNPNP